MDEAFNIKISDGGREVTLTILGQAGYYKVIYFGGIVGGIRFIDGEWELIDAEEMAAGDLPKYMPDPKGERIEVELNKHTVEIIGKEIELYNREAKD